MPCPQPNLTPVSGLVIHPTTDVQLYLQQVQLISQIPLMYSDNPETVNSGYISAVLWKYTMNAAGPNPIVHRIFSWHVNKLPLVTPQYYIGITIENTNNFPLTISSMKFEGGVPPSPICIAKALLAGTMANITPATTTIPPHTIKLLDYNDWNYNDFFGAEYEVTISASGVSYPSTFNYVLRDVYASQSSDLVGVTSPELPPVTGASNHPRGSWPQSEISAVCSFAFDDTTNLAPTRYFKLCDGITPGNNGGDLVFTDSNSVNHPALQNPGDFGAIYRTILLRITNQSSTNRTVKVFLNPRGGGFNGAVKSSSLLPQVRGIPNTDVTSGILLGSLSVPKNKTTQETISLAVGGESATPIALALQTL